MTRADITLTAMDSNGRLKHMACTRVEPFSNPRGKTAEERGATRYLGAYVSFLGWEEQESVTIKAIRNFQKQISRIHPNLKNAKAAIQSILTARVASGRLVMPSNKKVIDLCHQVVTQITRHCLTIPKKTDGEDDTNEIATTLLPRTAGDGLNFPDPETACTTQDARRLHDGLMSPDDRVADATWGALHHLTDSRTGQRKPNTADHFPTFAGRLQNLQTHGITAHRGRSDYTTLPEPPPPPQEEAETRKRQEIEEFLHHEMNTHLIPNTILFVPGNETHPPIRTEETETPTPASHNMFAAIGLAYQLKMTKIWAINHNKEEENTYNVVDLRTRTGRDQENMKDDSEIAKGALPPTWRSSQAA
jgi:hypothetical protein